MITLDMLTSIVPTIFYFSAIALLLVFLASISFALTRDLVREYPLHHNAGGEGAVKHSVNLSAMSN